MNYHEFFTKVTGRENAPFPYQGCLAEAPWPDVLEIPTGLGKTAAVVLAWLWKRGWRQNASRAGVLDETPRRLIYCLPMRVLVEQTQTQCERWLSNLGVFGEAGVGRVSVHVLTGGSEDLKNAVWAEHPQGDQILIGTQDMLLSRALMRGYGMSRYQWPVHFAWLHNDALWVFDEVQLMGPGLVTSAQLDAFRHKLKCAASSRSLWVSATLRRDWLQTVDFNAAELRVLELSDAEKSSEAVSERRESFKPLKPSEAALKRLKKETTESAKEGEKTEKPTEEDVKTYLTQLAAQIQSVHKSGTTTLAILNTVERALGLLRSLDALFDPSSGRKKSEATPFPSLNEPERLLIHSRFRAAERAERNRMLGEQPDKDGPGRIIIATQAIEAGVDLSARVLFTELAPWASMVQRFGRCNRYGEFNEWKDAQVLWIDVADSAPYPAAELDDAREKLNGLASASPAILPAVTAEAPLHPVLRRKDFLDLFSTEADLSGFDVDVAPYIRDADDADVLLFWREWTSEADAKAQPPATRDELCRAGLGAAGRMLKRLESGDVWTWDTREREWSRVPNPKQLRLVPGRTLMIRATCGGYSERYGLDPEQKSKPVKALPPEAGPEEGEALEDDHRSLLQRAIPLPQHLADVEEEARALCELLDPEHRASIVSAARWHDVGKAHEAFQSMLREAHLRAAEEELGPSLWAKSGSTRDPTTGKPRKSGRPRYKVPGDEKPRRHFRHELASSLAWLAQHDGEDDADLIAYLIAAHHGKVRMSLRTWPKEVEPPEAQRLFARGVWDGDRLPEVVFTDGERVPETTLHLDLMQLGEGRQGRSWTTRTQRLLRDFGPFRLAYFEALVRVADWRATHKEQP